MKFGLFGSAKLTKVNNDIDSSLGYNDWIHYNIEAEQLGYTSTFTVEHHFTGLGQVSASLNLLTYLAAKTSKIKLGTAVLTLPWHNPVLVAEQIATMDLLSGGRIELGVGKGYRYNEFKGFNIDMEEASDRFEESIDIIIKSWTNRERWSYEGKFWSYKDIIVEPLCNQKPHPTLWMAAGNHESIQKVAKRNANLLLDQFSPLSEVEKRVLVYKNTIEEASNKSDTNNRIALARALFIAKDNQEKMDIIEKRMEAKSSVDKLSERPDGNNKSSIMSFKGPDEALNGALIGTEDEIHNRLNEFKKIGIGYILLVDTGGGLSHLQKFANKIMPYH
jgi:alkanesulfonate monooxygenase SsuD/methylene tetrahydromethanopterin reductase-like flavin-dependent oxidoreductase (luciferase family)